MVEVRVVGKTAAGPLCATENTGGELTGSKGVELMEGCTIEAAKIKFGNDSAGRFCCSVCDRSCINVDSWAVTLTRLGCCR